MAQIRQEINLLNKVWSSTTTAQDTLSRAKLDTTQYNGTVTYYFEVVALNNDSVDRVITLRHGTAGAGTIVATATVTASTAAYSLFRSSSFTAVDDTDYRAHIGLTTSNGQMLLKSARIIIIQNATTLTNTETQIEIGNEANTTATTDTALTNPKYWQYTSANWDGTITAYFESTFISGTSKSAATMTLQESTDILAPSWSNIAATAITTTQTTAIQTTRSGAFTLTAGNWYRAVMKAGNSKSGITVYNAKVIIDQADGAQLNKSTAAATIQGGTAGAGETWQMAAQAFKIQTTSTISAVTLNVNKVGTPTDTFNVDIVSALDGASLANGTISGSSITSSVDFTVTFGVPVSLTGGNTYYIQISRSPNTRDATNYYNIGGIGGNVYSEGSVWSKNNTTWSEQTTLDMYFVLVGQAGFTKLEPQYLLANTLFAAGTGLQTFLTKWDSTEWDAGSGTITYFSQAEAANGSTSDVTIEEADGGGTLTNSTLTNIDNAQISSSAITMPTSQDLDTKATTNAGDVAAARILVYYVFASSPAVPQNVPYTNPNLKALLIMGVGT